MRTFKNDGFFARLEAICLAVTFNDLRLRSGFSVVAPAHVQLRTKCSRNIELNIPVLSSAMDTVTEHELAIAMAMAGGGGVIHKGRGMTPEVQAEHVGKVKNHLHTKIESPVTFNENQTISEILAIKREKGYNFHSFPILNDDKKLVGLLTRHHFEFNEDESKRAGEIMAKRDKVLTSVPKTTVPQAAKIMRESEKGVLPLVNSDDELVGMYVAADIQRLIKTSGVSNVDSEGHLVVCAAIGVGEQELERVDLLSKANVNGIVIDTAHGDSKNVFDTVRLVKEHYPHLDVIAGNVSQADSAERLMKAGVDGIKVGQGGGSICTTRIVAGIGCPQVTAVYNCAKVLRGSGVIVCSDGGIVYPGDMVIAIGAGADCVMLGRALAGTDESPGEIIKTAQGNFKGYRGMGSEEAMRDSEASRARYRQESSDTKKLVPEGISSMVPHEGSVADVLFKFIGGLRAGMGYVGAADIAELQEKADFDRLSPAGWHESNPHDVTVINPTKA